MPKIPQITFIGEKLQIKRCRKHLSRPHDEMKIPEKASQQVGKKYWFNSFGSNRILDSVYMPLLGIQTSSAGY